VFVLCHSLLRQHGSLENLKSKWLKEVTHSCPDKPIIILSLKSDLREMELGDNPDPLYTSEEIKKVAEELGAERHLQCSALVNEGLQDLLKALVDVGVTGKKRGVKSDRGSKSDRGCIVM
jgi:GTPase SAR1 family protein